MYFSHSHFFLSFKLTPGESHEKLRRVDSNRKSRSFSKQPSTGDYYKTLGSDAAEPQGTKGMAPNEEVSQMWTVYDNINVFNVVTTSHFIQFIK